MGFYDLLTKPFTPHVDEVSTPEMEILNRVALETNYDIDDLIAVYGYESSYGTDENMNKGPYQGPFQFSEDLANELRIDRYDLYESAKGFVESLPRKKRSMENNIKTTSGDFSFINSLDKPLLDYLLHQQGGKGVARLALAHYSGANYAGPGYGNDMYMHIIQNTLKENLSGRQKEELDKKLGPAEKVEYFISQTKKNLGAR